MKKIALVGVNAGVSGTHLAPGTFAEFLLKKKLLESAQASTLAHLICVDYSVQVGRRIRMLDLERANCSLVRMEPSIVLPANFAKSRLSQFKRIITVGGSGSKDSISVHWPLVWPSVSELRRLRNTKRVDRVVLVNGNKISFIGGELYSLRRKAIKALSNLDLYGTEWDSAFLNRLTVAVKSFAHAVLSLKLPRPSGLSLWFQGYSEFKGPVADKLATMSKYKFALVIENSAEYMSEKLMEALFAGCIPIYVGPDPENFGIPKKLVIWVDASLDSIQSGLKQASSLDFDDFHSSLSAFLGSIETRDTWECSKVYERILRETQTMS